MTPRRRRSVPILAVAALLACAQLAFAPAPAGAAAKLFELSDPRGDDYGDGNLIYPINSNFNRGELDLLSFTARRQKGGTLFEVTFARPVRQPGPGAVDDLGTPGDKLLRHGFYTFNVDVYIDTDRTPESGGVAMLPGRKAEVAPEHAWDRAICLTPQPFEAEDLMQRIFIKKLKEELSEGGKGDLEPGEVHQLRHELDSDLASRVYFPNRIRVRGSRVSFFVPDSFLGGPAQPTWSYVVVVSGADLVQRIDMNLTDSWTRELRERFMILPVAPDEWQNRFGGGRENSELQPPLIDILVPAGTSQKSLLGDFDSLAGRPVVLPGVVPAEEAGE